MFVGLMRQGILRRVSAVVYFADDSQVIRRGSFKQVVRLLNPSNCYSASTARNVQHSTGASNITAASPRLLVHPYGPQRLPAHVEWLCTLSKEESSLRMSTPSKIIYTFTDEAPALATYSLLPIVEAFAASAEIAVETRDISLAGRILASFADQLDADKQIADDLAKLAVLATSPDANIIKLPNISASVPQLKGAIAELQAQGFNIPNFPEDPQTDAEKDASARYSKVLGSAVKPVLREGNSDRRAPAAVKAFVRKHPHSMGKWSMTSQSHADYMRGGDFFSSEQSITMAKAGDVRIEFVGKDGQVEVKKQLALQEGEVFDSMFMSCRKLRDFFERTLQDCKENGVMWSLHVKATMMKVSHPIVFRHPPRGYSNDRFYKKRETQKERGGGGPPPGEAPKEEPPPPFPLGPRRRGQQRGFFKKTGGAEGGSGGRPS